MATYEQVMQALRNADASGDIEGAKRLAIIAKNMRDQKQIQSTQPEQQNIQNYDRQKLSAEMTHEQRAPVEIDIADQPFAGIEYAKPNKLAIFSQGIARGVQDIFESIHQTALDLFGDEEMANEFTKKVNERRASYEQGVGQSKYAGAGRMTGKIAPALAIPGMQTTLPVRVAVGAAEGAAIGGTGFRPEETQQERMQKRKEESIKGAAIGAAFPIGLKGIEKITSKGADRILKENAPTSETLKNAAREIYGEIDDIGATVNAGSMARLGRELKTIAKKEGLDPTITSKTYAAINRLDDFEGPQLISELETMRKIFKGAASSIDSQDARLGSIMVGKIDDFMDGLTSKNFIGNRSIEAGEKLKEARSLWQRAKKGELIDEAFEKAKNQASGFENGIRVQFRSLLNNKKKMRGFTEEEKNAIRQVVRGGGAENIAKAIGKFGFTEGQASTMLLGSLGVAGGAALGGAPGAVAIPLIGQVSKKLAQKLTKNNAEFANALVRSGNNGKQIVRQYMKYIPKSERNPEDLAQLLIKQKLPDLSAAMKSSPLVNDAVFIASLMQLKEREDFKNSIQDFLENK